MNTFDDIFQYLENTDDKSKNENALYEAICDRVAWFLENDVEMLMSYLYRLDIEENDLKNVFHNNTKFLPHEAIARLIFERQIKRTLFKKKFKVQPLDDEI